MPIPLWHSVYIRRRKIEVIKFNFNSFSYHIANFVLLFIQVFAKGVLIFASIEDPYESASDFSICILPDTMLEFVYVSKQNSAGLDFTKIWDVFQEGLPSSKTQRSRMNRIQPMFIKSIMTNYLLMNTSRGMSLNSKWHSN